MLMLKINELKVGDLVMVEYDGQWQEGEVNNIDRGDGKACVKTSEDQEFWYEPSHMRPIPLDEGQLFKLGFQKQENPDGSVKYSKGAFRVLLHTPGNFSTFEMWYREDKRHITQPSFVHDFQNKHLEMTKVVLEKGV